MTSFIYGLGVRAVEKFHAYMFNVENNLIYNPSEEVFKSIIDLRKKEVLNCTFVIDGKNYTPLEVAVRFQDATAINLLVEYGAPTDSIVHHYIEKKYYLKDASGAILNQLLDHADVNQKSKDGLMPLKAILKNGFKEDVKGGVEILFKRGANVNFSDKETAYDVLKSSFNLPVIDNHTPTFDVQERYELDFLTNMVDYLKLERRYFPRTGSHLSRDDIVHFTKFSSKSQREQLLNILFVSEEIMNFHNKFHILKA